MFPLPSLSEGGEMVTLYIKQVSINPSGQAVVEGTPIGRRLYEQCGLFAEIEEMRFDIGEEFAERKTPTLIFLTREPRT